VKELRDFIDAQLDCILCACSCHVPNKASVRRLL
jgi:hypothetical protein